VLFTKLYKFLAQVFYEIRFKFQKINHLKKWRTLNAHNNTHIGQHLFDHNKVKVGRLSYGVLNVNMAYKRNELELIIGNFVSIAPGVKFVLGVNHQTKTISSFPFKSILEETSLVDTISKGVTVIEDGVWIGENALILDGVRIGRGSIVAACSVVNKDVSPYSIVGGNPAKLIRYKFPDDIINIIDKIDFNHLSDDEIIEKMEYVYKEIHTVEDANLIVKKLESK
jgi:virginiamycin A acetyltransferase